MPKLTPETKDFKFTLDRMDDEAGQFTGYASVFDAVDSYNDSVAKGAFRKTLKEKKQFPLLWSHDIMSPIGVISGVEDEKGLSVEGTLNLDVQRAREIRSLIKQGAVTGLSIGYQTKKEAIDKDTGIRTLKEIALWEISPCVFPALSIANITDIKQTDFSAQPEAEPDSSTLPTAPPEEKDKPDNVHLLYGLIIKR